MGTIEGLLEGVVAFVISFLWSLWVLPLLFLSKRPFDGIYQAYVRKKPLPPLLFNFVGTIPVLIFVAYGGRLIYSIDRRGEWEAAWRTLSAEDTAQFLFFAGPPIAAIWIFVSLSSRLLARVTLQSIECARIFLLYFVGVLSSYLSIGIFLIFSAVKSSDGREGISPSWFVNVGLDYFTRVAPLVLLFALVVQLWREVKAKLRGASHIKSVMVTLLVCLFLVGVASMAGALCNAAWQIMERVRSDLIRERESKDPKVRGALSLDARNCHSNDESLRCVVLLHSFLSSDVQLVDVESASLMTTRPSARGKALQTYESKISEFSLKPAINEGEVLALAGGHQGTLYLNVPRRAICSYAAPGIPGEAYFLKLVFVGVIKDSSKAQGLDVFRPVNIHLDDPLVREMKEGCAGERKMSGHPQH